MPHCRREIDRGADLNPTLNKESCYEVRDMWFSSSSAGPGLLSPGQSESGLVQNCEVCVRSGAGQCKADAARPAYIARARRCLGMKDRPAAHTGGLHFSGLGICGLARCPIYDNVPPRQGYVERTPPRALFRAPFRSNGKRPAAKCCFSWVSPTKARVLNRSMEPRFHQPSIRSLPP